jgi:diaminopimelate decarboxylase
VCESSDVFGKNRKIKSDFTQGTYFAILSSGAYGMSMASRYNSRPLPAEILLHDSKVELITQRETYSDFIAKEK